MDIYRIVSDIIFCKNVAKLCSIHTIFYVIYSYYQILYFKAEVKCDFCFLGMQLYIYSVAYRHWHKIKDFDNGLIFA